MASRYLVTGGAGFIGLHLCKALLDAGDEVRVIDSLVPQVHGDSPNADAPLAGVDFIRDDIRNPDALRRAVKGVDGVFHLAAEVGVGQSMYEIVRYTGANDLGTAHLLEALAADRCGRLVVASSMSVYGEGWYETEGGEAVTQVRRDPARMRLGQWDPVGPGGVALKPVPTDEQKQTDLASIYALTKYVQERSTLIIGAAYDIEVVALRLFNVFGPGQALSNPYTGVLANFASRLLHGQAPMIFEDGLQRRDFVHVRDVVQAFMLAIKRPGLSQEVFNIGSGHSYTIAEVANLLRQAMGRQLPPPEILGKARSGDIRHCFSDIGKARSILGYEPQHPLEAALDELAAWVRVSTAMDRGLNARRELETRGLVA
ncbi:MAG TPA: NAD-dependent epimerase/dehydratase family protein [Ferrovibrio sp.]|uniref:NAD-dependent epimerase/dehydratase family protein n=1 Tax=Ferrovibrio sp. TaxID=1917215 RepID=UPI002ED44753